MFLVLFFTLSFQAEKPEVGVLERLGKFLPPDISFIDSEGKELSFRELLEDKKPLVLVPVFYTCKMVCPKILYELTINIDKISSKLYQDFYIITFSFDKRDDIQKAKELKKNYVNSIKKKIDPKGWKFIVLKDSTNLYKLTESIGFYFKREKDMFVHPSVLIFVSPDLKITRYLYGPEFLPFDFEMALYEASNGKLGGIRVKATNFCFSYDPKGRKYVFNFVKIFMIFSILFVISFATFMVLWIKKERKED